MLGQLYGRFWKILLNKSAMVFTAKQYALEIEVITLSRDTETHSLNSVFSFSVTYSGIAIAILLGLVFMGGIERITTVRTCLCPLRRWLTSGSLSLCT